MCRVLAPSDITLVERKYTAGVRRLSCCERLGLLGTPPLLWRRSYSKLGREELRAILERKLEAPEPLQEILRTRQEAVRKQVVSTNFSWGGSVAALLTASASLRFYDWKTRMIVLPFATYGGRWIGRGVGLWQTGAWAQTGRERVLGTLPAFTWLSDEED